MSIIYGKSAIVYSGNKATGFSVRCDMLNMPNIEGIRVLLGCGTGKRKTLEDTHELCFAKDGYSIWGIDADEHRLMVWQRIWMSAGWFYHNPIWPYGVDVHIDDGGYGLYLATTCKELADNLDTIIPKRKFTVSMEPCELGYSSMLTVSVSRQAKIKRKARVR